MIITRKKFSISGITDQLYVSGWPRKSNLKELREIGFDLIIHMPLQSPSKYLKAERYDVLRLFSSDTLFTPIPIRVLEKGVEKALPVMESGAKVLVYCKSGIHRSAAMATCILVSQGMSVDEAINLVKEKRSVAKPDTKHIKSRIAKFAQMWNEKKTEKNNFRD